MFSNDELDWILNITCYSCDTVTMSSKKKKRYVLSSHEGLKSMSQKCSLKVRRMNRKRPEIKKCHRGYLQPETNFKPGAELCGGG